MRTTSYLALSRQVALERHMATIANNLANATTSGYRAEHTVFEKIAAAARRARPGGLRAGRRPGPGPRAGADRADRQSARHRARRRRLPRLRARPAARAMGAAGRLEIDTDGQAGRRRRRTRCWTTAATRSRVPPRTSRDHHRRRRHVSGRSGPIGRIGIVGLRATSRRCDRDGRRPLATAEARGRRPGPAGSGRAGGLQRPAGPRDDDHDRRPCARSRARSG